MSLPVPKAFIRCRMKYLNFLQSHALALGIVYLACLVLTVILNPQLKRVFVDENGSRVINICGLCQCFGR